MKKYLQILFNRQLVGKWAKTNMVRFAVAAIIAVSMGVATVTEAALSTDPDVTVVNSGISTVTGTSITSVHDDVYTASGSSDPISADGDYYIIKNGIWTNVGGSADNLGNNAYVAINTDGQWMANGQPVAADNVYNIAGTNYVFKTGDNSLYSGSVYGDAKGTKLLKSAYDGTEQTTVWAVADGNQSGASAKLTVGQVNRLAEALTQNDINLAMADVKKIEQTAGSGNKKSDYTIYRADGSSVGTISDYDTTYSLTSEKGSNGSTVYTISGTDGSTMTLNDTHNHVDSLQLVGDSTLKITNTDGDSATADLSGLITDQGTTNTENIEENKQSIQKVAEIIDKNKESWAKDTKYTMSQDGTGIKLTTDAGVAAGNVKFVGDGKYINVTEATDGGIQWSVDVKAIEEELGNDSNTTYTIGATGDASKNSATINLAGTEKDGTAAAGSSVDMVGDKNIKVTVADGQINLALNDLVEVETVNAKTVESKVVNTKEVNVGSTKITENNITMGDTKITNENVTVGNTVVTGDTVTTNTVETKEVVLGKTVTLTEDSVNALDNRVTNNTKAIAETNEYIGSNEEVWAKDTITTVMDDGNGFVSVEEYIDKETGNRSYTVHVDQSSFETIDTNTTNEKLESKLEGSVLTTTITDSDGKTVTGDVDLSELKTKQGTKNAEDIKNINNRIEDMNNKNNANYNKLDNRVKKVAAGAAALAALHPLDFDPEDKLTFAAGYGNYRGQNSAAVGAFYRPDEKTMFSAGTTVADSDGMSNAGVAFSVKRVNNVTNSKTAMAREIMDLKEEVNSLKNLVTRLAYKKQNAAMFPDVPENHWAYEYVDGLLKAGVIEGYPDGMFRGQQGCTRYEFAALLFRAMKAGQIIPEALAEEFKPELGRFRVDRVSGQDADKSKVERVRVNTGKQYAGRDNYGTNMVSVAK